MSRPIPKLGQLEQLNLEAIWPNEAQDFTPWLAREENLRLLGEELGLSLERATEEVPVGPFVADILCRDMADGSWVVIENQIKRTDHGHLGQLLTYAAGLDAKAIVWVAASFTDQHRAALDWLNDVTSDEISFLGVEIQVWRIGSSDPAPRFNVVSKPNDWSRSVRETARREQEGDSELSQVRFEFWSAFGAWLSERRRLRARKPNSSQWMDFPLGTKHAHLVAIASTWSSVKGSNLPQLRVEVALHRPEAKEWYDRLEKQKHEIEPLVGEPLFWHNPPESKSAKVYVETEADFTNRALWPGQFEWLETRLVRLREVFGPLFKVEAGW